MSSLSAASAIRSKWASAWTAAPTAYGNELYAPIAGSPWVRLSVLDGLAQQVSIGSPGSAWDQHVGIVVIQVFTPAGEGEDRGRVLADLAAAVLRKQYFSGIEFLVPYCTVVGNDGAWWQINVTCPFNRFEVT